VNSTELKPVLESFTEEIHWDSEEEYSESFPYKKGDIILDAFDSFYSYGMITKVSTAGFKN